MREILFRARRLDNGEWAEGYLCKHPSAIQGPGYAGPWYIHVPPKDPDDNGGVYNVDRSTVGQWTGLTDRNGKRIFEGDIISIEFPASEPPDGPGGVFFENAEVFFSEVYHGWYVRFSRYSEERLWEYDNPSKVEVVGNCWDTPELLEGGLKRWTSMS